MDVLYHDIKTRYAHDFSLCFDFPFHELIMILEIYFSNSLIFHEKIQKKLQKFNQYLEIGVRLQPNLANFNLDFLPKYQ